MAVRMLPGETERALLRPHPVGWLGRYLVAALPALWGVFLLWLFRTDWWTAARSPRWWEVWEHLYGNAWSGYVLAVVGLGAAGAVAAVATIRWRTFFVLVAVALAAVGVAYALDDYTTMLPLALAAGSVPLLLTEEAERRSHQYRITNLRIVFRGGLFVRRERQVRHESITDLDGSQGPLGRLLGYGTIVPVTQSGFGLGEDSANAGIAVGGGAGRRGGFLGGGVTAGGGRSVQTARARSFHQLTAIRPYEDTKHLLETLIQEAAGTPYLREQVDLQRRMVQALERSGGREAFEATDAALGPET